MNEIKVSVIVPTRIRRGCCINMLKNMWNRTEEKNWEMIIVFDDYPGSFGYGEPDKGLYTELIENFKDNEKVQVLRSSDSKYEFDFSEKTGRIGAALNWGVQNTFGKYVLITSDDFFYTPSWLEILLKLSEQFDMKKIVINPVNVESFDFCDKNTDIKKKMWTTLREAGRRYFFGESFPLTESELIEYWNKTKMDTFDTELNCGGQFGSTGPLFMLRTLWLSMGGRNLNFVGHKETEFHDRLKAMAITKIIPRDVYSYNFTLNLTFDLAKM